MREVHSEDVAASSTLKIVAYVTAPSGEDPALDFDYGTAVATCTINSSTVAPVLLLANLTAGFGAFLVIKIEGVQSGGNCTATISVEIVAKS